MLKGSVDDIQIRESDRSESERFRVFDDIFGLTDCFKEWIGAVSMQMNEHFLISEKGKNLIFMIVFSFWYAMLFSPRLRATFLYEKLINLFLNFAPNEVIPSRVNEMNIAI